MPGIGMPEPAGCGGVATGVATGTGVGGGVAIGVATGVGAGIGGGGEGGGGTVMGGLFRPGKMQFERIRAVHAPQS